MATRTHNRFSADFKLRLVRAHLNGNGGYSGAADEDPCDPRRVPGLRLPARPSRAQAPGHHEQPQKSHARDASRRSCDQATCTSGHHHQQQSRLSDLSKFVSQRHLRCPREIVTS